MTHCVAPNKRACFRLPRIARLRTRQVEPTLKAGPPPVDLGPSFAGLLDQIEEKFSYAPRRIRS